ncbi:MAG: hypothetical protein H8F28_24085, partial [Fibrella sp.]|nr:hypothetical protein [Armatimonadota bacterium]
MRSINPLIPYHFVRAGWAFRHLRTTNPATYRINNDEMIDPLRRYQDERAGRIVAYAA